MVCGLPSDVLRSRRRAGLRFGILTTRVGRVANAIFLGLAMNHLMDRRINKRAEKLFEVRSSGTAAIGMGSFRIATSSAWS